ncbi:MAG: SH3 domain-containing protein [Alcanivorax sp.]
MFNEFSAVSISMALLCLLAITALCITLWLLSRSRKEFWEIQRAYLLRRASTLSSVALAMTIGAGATAIISQQAAHHAVRSMSGELEAARAQLAAQADTLAILERRIAIQQQAELARADASYPVEPSPLAEPDSTSPRSANAATDSTPARPAVRKKPRLGTIATGGASVFLRGQPGGQVVGSVANGASLQLLTDDHVQAQGTEWIRVRLEDGRTGWVAQRLLQIENS